MTFREHPPAGGEIFNAPMISKDVRDLAAADVEGFDAVMPRSNSFSKACSYATRARLLGPAIKKRGQRSSRSSFDALGFAQFLFTSWRRAALPRALTRLRSPLTRKFSRRQAKASQAQCARHCRRYLGAAVCAAFHRKAGRGFPAIAH